MKIPTIGTDEILRRVNERLGGDRPCSLCGTTNWVLADEIYEVESYEGKQLGVPSKTVMPVVVLICTTCGHMVNLSATALGIIDRNTGGWAGESPK